MKILAIDTSTFELGIGYYDGAVHTRITTPDPKSHNKTLLKEIDELLAENVVSLAEIDVFGVVIGPGSFTGIRIGVATVNAFAKALNKPVVEITSLEQLADGTEKLVMLDCKHNNYYVGIFSKNDPQYCYMKKDEIENVELPKEELKGVYPEKLLQLVLEKAERGEVSQRAKPFYMKNSSAETGE